MPFRHRLMAIGALLLGSLLFGEWSGADESADRVSLSCYQAFAGENDVWAWERCTLAAEEGDTDAQVKLATLYAQGRGTARDLDASIDLLRKAALNGNPEAQYNLASAYQFGQGVDVDLQQALEWYQRAAELGHGRAQRNLASMYELGLGGDVDPEAAARWYLASAENGVADSQLKIGLLQWEGNSVERDRASARSWIREAAMAGNTDAQFALGAILLENERPEALNWWRRAADRGHVQAMYHLAEQLAGERDPAALERARRYTDLAIRAGHPEAVVLRARILDSGPAVPTEQTAAASGAGLPGGESASDDEPTPNPEVVSRPDSLLVDEASDAPAVSVDVGTREQRLALDVSWILTRDREHYTLQMGFSSSLPGIRGLVSRYGLEDEAHIYATMWESDVVFMLVYGEFETHAAATAAATRLRREYPRLELFVQRVAVLQDRFEAPRTDVSGRQADGGRGP